MLSAFLVLNGFAANTSGEPWNPITGFIMLNGAFIASPIMPGRTEF